jgi:type IV pilus assembly protein PilB
VVGDPSRPASPAGEGAVVEAPSARRVLLGELLVESKVITAEQLGEVLQSPRETGKKLGQVLLERGWITEAQLTQTLSLQLSVPWVSLSHIDFSRQLLNRLNRDVADRYCLIPIFVRHVKGQGETLYVAMDDPTNEAALQEVSRMAGLPTKPMIASASDIRSAIRVYYGEPSTQMPAIDVPIPPTRIDPPTATTRDGKQREVAPPTPPAPTQPDPVPPTYGDAPRAVQPSVPPPPTMPDEPPPVTARSHPPPAPPSPPPPPKAEPSKPRLPVAKKSDPNIPKAEESEPTARRRPRMVNLTLLDGTTITLPKKKSDESEGLTARDFISALRATAHGADASEILGDQVRWEPVVAALLSILLRKGLIADWEFIEELRKG